MTHFTTFDSFSSPDVYHPEFQPEPNGFESPHGTYFAGHDPLTGLDTGSGNDRFNQYVTGDGSDQLQLDTGSGNERLTGAGLRAHPGGTGFFGDEIHGQWSFFGDEIHFIHNVGGTAGPGGTTYMTGVDHLGQFGHEADHFTNFAMPVGDFI